MVNALGLTKVGACRHACRIDGESRVLCAFFSRGGERDTTQCGESIVLIVVFCVLCTGCVCRDSGLLLIRARGLARRRQRQRERQRSVKPHRVKSSSQGFSYKTEKRASLYRSTE